MYARKKSWIERSEDMVESSRRETVKGVGWWSAGSRRSAWFGWGGEGRESRGRGSIVNTLYISFILVLFLTGESDN